MKCAGSPSHQTIIHIELSCLRMYTFQIYRIWLFLVEKGVAQIFRGIAIFMSHILFMRIGLCAAKMPTMQ